jgi:hypothetical protein
VKKKRKYGEAWKDVQIDAEASDSVFERFFRHTPPTERPAETRDSTEAGIPSGVETGLLSPVIPLRPKLQKPAESSPAEKVKSVIADEQIEDVTGKLDSGNAELIINLKQCYRLSKGEASILGYLIDNAADTQPLTVYVKVPELSTACQMTDRGCQFGLRNLQLRGLLQRVQEYDPLERRGVKYHILLPSNMAI